MEQVSLSRTLARFIADLSYEDLPPQVIERSKTCILDALSSCFAGRDLPWSQIAVKLVEKNKGGSTIFSYEAKVAAVDAALANAVLSHSILMEDYVPDAGHPSILVVPVAIAVAEEEGLPGTDVITAIVLGYDVLCRVSLGLAGKTPPAFRAVPILGPFGAVVAAGKLLKLNENQLANALGYAANFASGLRESWSYGSMEGMFHAGIAAHNGILLTNLAKMGATAAETALEGKHGFYMAFTGGTGDMNAVTADLGKRFLIMELLAKLYPADFYHQIPIDLAITLKDKIEAEDIEKIVDRVSPKIKSAPGNDFAGPFANQFQAQLSGQFCLAAALLSKLVRSPTLYTQHYNDPEILEVAKKVELVAEEGRERFKPRVEVFLKDGRWYAAEEDRLFKFIPTREMIEEKFMTLASDFLGKRKAAEVIDTVMNLDKLDNINKLTQKLGG